MTVVEVVPHLERTDILAVFDLVDAAARHDGTTPLSEHVLLHLRHGGDAYVRHLLVRDNDAIVGYAHLDTTDEVEGPSAELVVHPDARCRGTGSALIARLTEESGDRLRLWAHGRSDAAESLATAHGFERSRVLWQMRRSLLTALPSAQLPAGYTLRSFAVGVDDVEWLATNAAAFANLPDQGGWDIDDLQRRIAEPWFDPQGFLVADGADGHMAGFHWTKAHGGAHDHTHAHPDGAHAHADGQGPHEHSHGHEPLGEVYVIGVHPTDRRTGLGRALLLTGLEHLRKQGLTQAMLYVDAANTAAIALYSDLGFTRWDTDTLYRRGGHGSSAVG